MECCAISLEVTMTGWASWRTWTWGMAKLCEQCIGQTGWLRWYCRFETSGTRSSGKYIWQGEAGPFIPDPLGLWLGQKCNPTYTIHNMLCHFIMNINSNLEWENTQNIWPFGWFCYQLTSQLWCFLTVKTLISIVGNSFGWENIKYEDLLGDENPIQGHFLVHLHESILWVVTLGLEERSKDVRRVRRLVVHPDLHLSKHQRHPSFTHMLPRPHLEGNGLPGSGVVPPAVLETPGTRE